MIDPGVYYNLGIDEYHADGSISKSGLFLISDCPDSYYRSVTGNRKQPTEAMMDGSRIHAAILEPERYKATTVVAPDCRRGSKAWAEFAEGHVGLDIIKADQHTQISGIVDAVRAHKSANWLLSNGKPEVSFFWQNEDPEASCRCRPDYIRDDVMVDVKTCNSASMADVQREIVKYAYYGQAAYYLDGASANNLEVRAFVFIFIEKSSPYRIACYQADGAMIEAGRQWYRKHLETYAGCIRTGQWPGWPDVVQPISLPHWAG